MTHDELRDYIDKFDAAGMLMSQQLKPFEDKKGHCCVPVKEVIQAIEKSWNEVH
jgi:hypothetical protein